MHTPDSQDARGCMPGPSGAAVPHATVEATETAVQNATYASQPRYIHFGLKLTW